MADVLEVTVLENGSSDVAERDFTAEEAKVRNADIAAAKAARERSDSARTTALAKLTALGLTEADIAALGL